MAGTPLVTVCMVTYNHEKYVGAAIQSVLEQTCGDLELVIVNDGSTDATSNRIAEFKDQRIVAIHQENQGPAAATNKGIAAARGKYIALFSGDDLCHPNRLQVQLDEYAKGGQRVLFSDCDFVDESGQQLAGEHFAQESFAGAGYTRAQTLARLFHRGNFLNGVTVFTERQVLADSPYDPTLLQLQDFELWVRLVAKCDLFVQPERLLSYRIRGDGANLSSPNIDAVIRSANEHYLILRRFFDGVPLELFREAFADVMRRPNAQSEIEYACERAFLYLQSPLSIARLIGTEWLHGLLNNPASAAVLARHYGCTPVQFFEILRVADAVHLFGNQTSCIFYDTGEGWSEAQSVRRPANLEAREFSLRFKLPTTSGLRGLRWDPTEGQPCRVCLSAIEERDQNGAVRSIDLAKVASNGTPTSNGEVEFETKDPSFWWPVTDDIVEVTVRGTWEFDYLHETVQSLRDENRRLRDTIAGRPSSLEPTELSLFGRVARKFVRRLKAG